MEPVGLPKRKQVSTPNYVAPKQDYKFDDSWKKIHFKTNQCCNCATFMHLTNTGGKPCGNAEECGCKGLINSSEGKNPVHNKKFDYWDVQNRVNLIWGITEMWGGHSVLEMGYLNEPFPFYES